MDLKMKAALWAPVPHWRILLLAGVGPTFLAGAVSKELMLPAIFVAWALQIFVYGRIVSQVLPERVSGFWEILREHGANYLVVGIIVGVIAVSFQFFLLRVVPSGVHPVLVRGLVRGAFSILLVFVWPLVFLKYSSIGSLFSGVLFLVRNIGSSWWIIGIVVIAQLIQASGVVLFLEHGAGWTFGTLLISAFLSVYLGTVSFTGALYSLINVRVEHSPVEA